MIWALYVRSNEYREQITQHCFQLDFFSRRAAKKGETQKLGKLDEVVGRTAGAEAVVVYGGGKAI